LKKLTVAIDASGGAYGFCVTVPAALDSLAKNPNLHIILVGDPSRIHAVLSEHQHDVGDRLEVMHTSEAVAMDESPALALRHKKDSSMRVSINLVKEGKADACVSAGNTGALMAIARFVLKTLPGIDRPAFVVAMPNDKGVAQMLDLGANVDSTPE